MRNFLFLAPAVLFLLISRVSLANGENQLQCHHYNEHNVPRTQKLWDGYEISIGPARNGKKGDGGECTAAVYSKSGKVIYRTSGFGVDVDLNQSLKLDSIRIVIVRTDTGGGNHCCHENHLIGLSGDLHFIIDVPEDGATNFKNGNAGILLVYQLKSGPHGFTSMANNPFAQKVYEVRQRRLVDVTVEHCDGIFADSTSNVSSAIKELSVQQTVSNTEEGRSAVLTGALQYVFCKKYDKAAELLKRWPGNDRAKMKKEFLASVSEYPEFANFLLGK